MKIRVERSYAEARRAEYPSIEDQLDALWKGGAEAEALRKRVQAVKAKHPKASPGSETPGAVMRS